MLEDGPNRVIISILDYDEFGASTRDERNSLLTSLEMWNNGRSSIVTAPLLSTDELSALANWFEQLATGRPTAPIRLREPCLFFSCSGQTAGRFHVLIRMEAEASPAWTKYYAEPFAMEFRLTHPQMLENACSLRRMHLEFPTQS